MKKSGLPRYVIQYARRDGRVRLLYRYPGRRIVTLPTPYGSDAFWTAYAAAKAGQPIQTDNKPARHARPAQGTMRHFVEAYYKSAPDFVGGDKLTRSDKKGVLESILAEPLSPDDPILFDHCPVSKFTALQVVKLRDRKAALPSAANKRLRYLNMLFEWGVEAGHATANPVEKVKKLKVPRKGYHSWTPDEVRRYEAKHPIGTKARLALALILFTGLRVSDLSQAGSQHVRDDWLELPQHKNRNKAPKMISVPILPILRDIIDQSPTGESTFLVTEAGNAFTVKGMANKVKDWCIEAGLTHCSAHGVRKAGATVAAENGATEAQLMAIFGWDDAKQAVNYTRAARRKKMAKAGMHLLIPRNE